MSRVQETQEVRRTSRPAGRLGPRRVSAALIAVFALTAGVLVTDGGRPVGEAHAATLTCVKHTKRVVTHAKRHGKRTRVVRLKHYRTCAETPIASPAPVSVPAPPAPIPTAPIPAPNPITEPPKLEQLPEPEPNAVSVTATDEPGHFTYTPSRTVVRSGRLTVEFNNQGMDAHDMYMQRVGPQGEPEEELVKVSEVTQSTKQTLKTFEVQPGTYRMWCSFGNHAMEGMEAHIEVKAAE